MAADIGVPDILADRQADHHPPEHHRFGQRAGLEQPHLVEGAVVGQLVLEADRRDLALVEQGHPVVEVAVDHEDRADQHRRPAIGRNAGHALQLLGSALDQRGFQHQILGRIADQLHFREDDQVGPGGPGPLARGEHRPGIAGNIADRLVQLGKRDGKRIDHGAFLSAARALANGN